MSKIPSNKTLAKAILIFGSAQVVSVLAALIRSKAAAQTVGPQGVGLTALYLSITAFVATAVSLGLSTSGVQAMSKAHGEGDIEQERHLISILRLWEVVSGGLGMLLMLVFSPLLCLVYFGSWDSHLHSVIMLSVVPAATIVSGIEGAILRSLQQTKRLTLSLIVTAIITVVVSVPLYSIMGWNGIPFIIASTAVLSAVFTFIMGHRTTGIKPAWQLLCDLRQLWSESRPMISLGVAFIISGLCMTSSELLLQSYINYVSTLFVVGLYKMGYQLSITYPSMIFTAIENDFYPRLTALGNSVEERNSLIVRQIRILVSIVVPCILLFIILLPWIIPLLLSDDFVTLVPMVSFGALAIIVRAVYLPIAYLPLALGRSKDFIHMEVVSSIGLVVCAITGCKLGGLTGIGVSFIASQTFDLVYAYFFCKRKYGFSL